jgi:arginine decarboxylase
MVCLRTSDLIPEEFRPSAIAQPLRSGLRNMMAAWERDEFVLDPSRITLSIDRTGYEGDTFKRDQLMDRHGVQINMTSRNTVLFHDQHRHHPQLSGVPGRGTGQDRP